MDIRLTYPVNAVYSIINFSPQLAVVVVYDFYLCLRII